ncbi:MAG: hypothetical protein A3C80_01680 [Candidatus Ryanbacteria bacterium RIFCSPHIGHO2_02_FULL_45_43]|uniref:N-acetyltransferase domain-containing protein n=1 Tax=Candidatus Ryanbacteria bacterium RIFCSPHIGHO2_01_45_13 TaxID=1802112 RepID=A0A1G2FYY8_9BACT|nr:MAG: hypothetical protein A2718_02515 [Candidatus Ryanbacteria bacterium RIFCSPHIGHO2_01_FULL_44_130]OGZ42952.1 MAG: hypothetical protein A2W41_02455 [Candidatus Ryanbacteria bacterium RIFCSPHIGHO2_01_45_13]OGZ48657.1 MAG: hypothetical protein A3C80_01680 [Candidatus Ryanbacteria bacterium RIFCSPHIGHO2_02_FULL_45_43]OGZ50597.1 MAG: hypothetical protein A3E55_03160 [Candidatus Ryanbacteria bacterium RIFCSPHIGHO2_12_FULL_44_20]OGZ51903.1 MAG: hypothetical protein A3A17_00535 [Candidatus Ryanba
MWKLVFYTKILLLKIWLSFKGYELFVRDYNSTPSEVFIFRKKIYQVENYFGDNIKIEDVWKDKYDEKSFHVYVKNKNSVIGASRLTYIAPLPITDVFNVHSLNNSVGEFSRLVIETDLRGNRRLILIALTYGMLKASRKIGIRQWVAFMPLKFKNSLERLGVKFSEISQQALTNYHIQNRSILSGYFKNDIRPYIIKTKSLKRGFAGIFK